MPAEELRMAPETLTHLRAWVEGKEGATQRTAARVAAYGAGGSEVVPPGWVRLLLA